MTTSADEYYTRLRQGLMAVAAFVRRNPDADKQVRKALDTIEEVYEILKEHEQRRQA